MTESSDSAPGPVKAVHCGHHHDRRDKRSAERRRESERQQQSANQFDEARCERMATTRADFQLEVR
jgi:hypothetical protein